MNWESICRNADRLLFRQYLINRSQKEGGIHTSVEFFLHALAACLTTSLIYHAAARGIQLESIETKLEGALDLQGSLGPSNHVRCGDKQLRPNATIKS